MVVDSGTMTLKKVLLVLAPSTSAASSSSSGTPRINCQTIRMNSPARKLKPVMLSPMTGQ